MEKYHSLFLLIAILFPFLSGLYLLVVNQRLQKAADMIAFAGFAVPAAIALALFCRYTAAPKLADGYAFFASYNTGLQAFGITLKLGLNGISLPMFLLAGVVGLAAGLCAISAARERKNLYLGLLLFMQAGLMGTFASIDIFFFYFFHELALIPTFIMIGIWGSHGKRSIAMELTIYLTLGAMLSLIGLIAIYSSSALQSFDLISLKGYLAANGLSQTLQNNIFALLLFGFGILVSLFPFHSWAPRGYGAAPTSAAMLHAGVLKKFGLYGLIQIAAPLLPEGASHWAMLLALLALGNILFIGFVTIAQKDLKQMIGYSSVMHMGYCFLGIATLSAIGVSGAVILMLAHGLSVALLFLLCDYIQNRTETLDMPLIGGLYKSTPILAAFFIAATFANVGLPGFANFWGELPIFLALWNYHPTLTALAVLGIIISAIYGLRAVSFIFLGKPTESLQEKLKNNAISDLSWKERAPAIILTATLVLVGFWPKLISDPLNEYVAGPTSLYAKNAKLTATLQNNPNKVDEILNSHKQKDPAASREDSQNLESSNSLKSSTKGELNRKSRNRRIRSRY